MHQTPQKVEGDWEQMKWRKDITGGQKSKRFGFAGSTSSKAASFGSCLSAAGCKLLDFGGKNL